MNLTAPGFTLTASSTVPVSTAPDGCPIVHGPVTITDHDGDWAVLNQRGYAEAIAPLPAGPITLAPGDVLIVGKEYRAASGRGGYMAAAGRSSNSRMAAIACVGYPKPPGLALFRVAGIGGGPILGMLRGYQIPVAQMSLSLLPSSVVIEEHGIVEELEGIFARFCGEVKSQWASDQMTPDLQHPGYGTWLASYVSQAMVVLCSQIPVARKAPLAKMLVQWGLDIAGAFLDGRVNQPNGGHMQGRKALVVLAGHLLGIPQMAHADSLSGLWQESRAWFTAAPAWWFGWPHGWNCYSDTDGQFLASHPSQWTTVDPPNGRCDVYRVTNYFPAVAGAQVGTALACKLMGLEPCMGHAFVGGIEQWMQGPPAEAQDAMAAVGVRLPWGTDYCVNGRASFCSGAWRQVFG